MKRVTAAILMKDSKVLIAQRPSSDPLAHKWEFPGGKVEAGETDEECLAREMSEEFGVQVAVHTFWAKSIYDYAEGSIELLAYFVEHISGRFELRVHDAIQWVTLAELNTFDFAPADQPIVDKLQTWYFNQAGRK